MPFLASFRNALRNSRVVRDNDENIVPLVNGSLDEYEEIYRETINEKLQHKKKKNRLYQRWEFVKDDMKAEVCTTAMDRLHNLQAAIEKLDRMAYDRPRPIMHRNIHKLFTMGALKRIFKDEYNAHLPDLIEMFGDVPNEHIIVTVPRRHGKTVATAWWLAAFLWTQPDARACAFSVAKRTTEMFGLKVQHFLMMLGGEDIKFTEHNKETTAIINMYGDAGGVSIAKFYPSRQDIELGSRFIPTFVCLSVCLVSMFLLAREGPADRLLRNRGCVTLGRQIKIGPKGTLFCFEIFRLCFADGIFRSACWHQYALKERQRKPEQNHQ